MFSQLTNWNYSPIKPAFPSSAFFYKLNFCSWDECDSRWLRNGHVLEIRLLGFSKSHNTIPPEPAMCPSCISWCPPSRHIAWRGCNRQADYTQGCRWPLTWKSNFQATTIDFPSPPYTMSLLKSAHNFAPFSWCAGMSHADKLPSAAFKPRLLFLLSLPAIEQTVFADESLLLFLRHFQSKLNVLTQTSD